jgi:transcriptional regulator with XRE-family HTH domain
MGVKSMSASDFCIRLKRLRKEYRESGQAKPGLTLRELGARTGIRTNFLADLEGGRRKPGRNQLERIAKGLGLEGEHAAQFVEDGIGDTRIGKVADVYGFVPKAAPQLLIEEVRKALLGDVGSTVEEVLPSEKCDLMWKTDNGTWIALELVVASANDPDEALRKLRRKLSEKGKAPPKRSSKSGD